MITTRRAAERFDQSLKGSDRTSAPVQVADAIASLPTQQIAPSSEFRTSLRSGLDAEMAELSAARAEAPPAPRPAATVVRVGRKRQILAGTVAAVLVSGTAAAVASTAALPGDLLYPLKRGIEDVRGAVGGDATRAEAQLDFARERLSEAETLVLRGDTGDVEAAEVALRDFGTGAATGTAALLAEYADDGDPAHLVEVQRFVGDVVPQLERIRGEAPESLHATIDALLRQLLDVGGGLTRTLASCGQPCADAGVTGLGATTTAVLERAGPGSSASSVQAPTAPSAPLPAGSAAPAAPSVPGAPAAPSGEVQIGDDAGVGLDDDGLVANLPGVEESVDPGSAGTTGEVSVPSDVVDVPIQPDEPIEPIPSDPLGGAVDDVVDPVVADTEVTCVVTLLDDCG